MSGKSFSLSKIKGLIVNSFAIFGFFIVIGFAVIWFYPYTTPTPLEKKRCAFCDPSVIARQKFYEDENFYILYTHKPVTKGHCLIVPKDHMVYFQDMDEQLMQKVGLVIERAHQIVYQAFDQQAYLILQKNGLEVGQEVPHVHFHYIPRDNGEFTIVPFAAKILVRGILPPISNQEMQEMTSKLIETRKSMNLQ